MASGKNLRTEAAFIREYQQDAMKTVPRVSSYVMFRDSMPEG